MERRFDRVRQSSSPLEVGLSYADFLTELVHLDELTGQSKRDIFSAKDLVEALADPAPEQPKTDPVPAKVEITEDLPDEVLDETKRLSDELNHLYDEYNEQMITNGRADPELIEKLLSIEDMLRDYSEPTTPIGSQKGE